MPVKFIPCPNCGLHGHIEFDDGRLLPEVTSKDGALLQVDRVIALSLVTEDEGRELREEIGRSSLCQTEEEAIEVALGGPLLILVTALGLRPLGTARRADVSG